MTLLDFLGFGKPQTAGTPAPAAPGDTDTIRRIVKALQGLDPDKARRIAAFAFILSRVANADMEISEEETREMERIVMQWGGLPEDQAVLVVQIARHQNILFGGTDNFIVTREFKNSASLQEKEELLHCLFAVSAADDSISTVEEGAISQIAGELGLSREELVAVRSQYRDKRAVMKDLPR